MKIVEVNEGKKIDYSINGNKITFGDDELTLNLSKYERDEEVTINICNDEEGILTSSLSKYFVANIIIPAKKSDDAGNSLAFDMENVTMNLWAVEV